MPIVGRRRTPASSKADDTLRREVEGDWKKIKWEKDIETAMKTGRERIDTRFAAFRINIADQGVPAGVPALEPWRKSCEKDWRHKCRFATSVVIMADGNGALGTSGRGHTSEWNIPKDCDAKNFQAYLDGCLDRSARSGGPAARRRQQVQQAVR
jgi:hypothetical protein